MSVPGCRPLLGVVPVRNGCGSSATGTRDLVRTVRGSIPFVRRPVGRSEPHSGRSGELAAWCALRVFSGRWSADIVAVGLGRWP
ncbi:hypothetical protein Tsp_02007, partial [Trichinella spiralis]|uniref:hypothetical protein n=1 Tax=Trichinella spiralis TaxID=6334 RepID=UPI0001EFBAC7